jgi:hypothetical protein
MRIKFLLLTGLALVCLFTALSLRPDEESVSAQAGTVCLQATAPLVTHGLTPIQPLLPNGDLFLLPTGMGFVAAAAPAGSTSGTVTAANFGSLPSTAASFGFTGTSVPFFSNPTANSTLRAVSCVDDIWDINFVIASSGNTEGDRVRWTLGSELLAEFTVVGNGVRITARSIHATIFVNNILANTGTLNVGDFIGFSVGAGTAGARTPEITIALSTSPSAPTRGCHQLALDIINAGGAPGTLSVAITSIVVKRMGSPASGTGLLTQFGGGLTGLFPTGALCPVNCPTPCPPPGGGQQPPLMCPFNMICFHTPFFYCGGGRIPFAATTVRIPQINFGYPVNVRTGGVVSPIVLRYLGCGPWFYESGGPNASAARRLTTYYLAAQFSLDAVDRTASLVNLSEQVSIGCYLQPAMMGMPAPNPFPLTLSNGVVLRADTKFCVLFDETERAIREMRTADINALLAIYRALLTCEGD